MLNKKCTINTEDHTINAGDCLSIIVNNEVKNYIVKDGVDYEIDCECGHLFRKEPRKPITYYDPCQPVCE